MSKPRNTVAFTLIELLVVISIIALLVGILLPALGAARESARSLVCQTNVKNVSTAFIAYGTDNRAYWPGWAKLGMSDPDNEFAGAWINPGSLLSKDPAPPKDISKGSIYPYTPDKGVFSCPSDEFAYNSSGVSYTISHHIFKAPVNSSNPIIKAGSQVEPAVEALAKDPTNPGNSVLMRYPWSDKFREPSNLIFVVDEGGASEEELVPGIFSETGVNDGYFENLFSELPGGNAADGSADKIKWYHSNGAAFGFADGHGEIRKQDDEEIYKYDGSQLVGPSSNRRFFYGRIWDPAAMAPTVAGTAQ